VIEGVRRYLFGSSQLAISDTGTMVYLPGPTRSSATERVLSIATRDGAATNLGAPTGDYAHVRASRDGTRLAIDTDDGRNANIWIYRLAEKSALQRFTIGGNNRLPVWSPDGRFLAFQSDRGGDLAIYRQRVDGADPAERLTAAVEGERHLPESWSPDGRHISFAVQRDSRYRLHTLTVADKKVTAVSGAESEEPPNSIFSPDGKWLAYANGPAGGVATPNRGVFVQPFPPSGAIYQAPRQVLDFHPVWSARGDELMYVPSATSGQMAAVSISTQGGVTFGAPVMFRSMVTGDRLSGEYRAFDTLPDGRFVGITSPLDPTSPGGSSADLRVVLNWFEELKRTTARQ
jgi:Tol biopolymer transport system component